MALAYRDYQHTACPQCGTRPGDWDHGGADDTEDAYVAVIQRCVGCQVIADKQEEAAKEGDLHGKKIALIPYAVHAAREVERELKERDRRARRRDRDDE
ncbi:hypothetical protein [Streptomyces sp. NPDC056069]|uniref:hypothetical protein n=1 Tax=Streptomyces sp. NPDC056069 TaxID=3345702 RepID=UPI0035DB7BAD